MIKIMFLGLIVLVIGISTMPVVAEDDSLPATPINEIMCVYSPFLVQAPDGEFHCADEENIERLLESGFTLVDISTPPEPIDVPEITLVPSTPLIMLDDPLSDEFDEIDHNNNIEPSLTIERENDIIYLTWDNIHTTDNTYDLFVIEDGVTSKITSVKTSGYASGIAYRDTHTHYDRLINADSIGVGGIINGSPIDRVFMIIPTYIPSPPTISESSVIVKRYENNSIELTWENISTNSLGHNIHIIESNGTDTLLVTYDYNPPRTYHTFFSSDSDPYSIAIFNRINNAEQVGVSGFIGEIHGPVTYVSVPRPEVYVERLDDNSLKLFWENMLTTDGRYDISITELGDDVVLKTMILSNHYIFPPNHHHFDRVNNADRIGVSGVYHDGTIPETIFTSAIPPLHSSPIPPIMSHDSRRIGFDWIKASCSDPTLKSDDSFFDTITVKSKPIQIPTHRLSDDSPYGIHMKSSCILPSSISVHVPRTVQIGEVFDVTITPSFELTRYQLDKHNENRPNISTSGMLWDKYCSSLNTYYRISHPTNYELSGDGVSYSKNDINDHHGDVPYEEHISHLDGLSFDGDSTTFQMTICKDAIYLDSDISDRKTSNPHKIDSGYFSILPNSVSTAMIPVPIYTSINGDLVTLSGLEPWLGLQKPLNQIYEFIVQFLTIIGMLINSWIS